LQCRHRCFELRRNQGQWLVLYTHLRIEFD
jgi:hypothetical protein